MNFDLKKRLRTTMFWTHVVLCFVGERESDFIWINENGYQMKLIGEYLLIFIQ